MKTIKPQILRKLSREFNKYRYPECRVKIIKNEDDRLIAEFTGTANFMCCFDEHFEDYRQMLEEHGEKVEIKDVVAREGKFIVVYVRNLS